MEPLFTQLIKVVDHDNAVHHRYAKQSDKAHRGWHRKIKAGQGQEQDSSNQCQGHIEENQQYLADPAESEEKDQENQSEGGRNHHRQTGGGPLLIFKLSAKAYRVASWQIDIFLHACSKLLNEADHIASLNVSLQDNLTPTILTLDLDRSIV
jgi:hypothetical protein